MGSSVPVKLPVWLGMFPVSQPKALLCAPMLPPFRRGCSDPSGFVRLGSLAFTHSSGESHLCRSAWLGSTHVYSVVCLPSDKNGCPPACWELCCRLPVDPRAAGPILPHRGGCRHGQGVLWGKSGVVSPLHGFFLPFPYV